MLTSISPLGERARGQRWPLTVGAYTVASTAAGAALGATLGALGHIVLSPLPDATTTVALVGFVVLGAAGLVLDAGPGRLRVPGPRRQVNEDWLNRYRGWVYGAGFGAQLGAAFTTIVMVSAVYVVFAAAFLSGSVAAGALLGAVFGLARALPILFVARVRDASDLRRFVDLVQRGLGPVHRSVLAAQGCAVLAAVVVLGAQA